MTEIANAPAVTVTDNRDASADDAKCLARIFHLVSDAIKKHKKAVNAVKEGWLDMERMPALRLKRDDAQYDMDETMDSCWEGLCQLPSGTAAIGGATRQTVALQLFNRSVNRNLQARITGTEARDLNRRSFG